MRIRTRTVINAVVFCLLFVFLLQPLCAKAQDLSEKGGLEMEPQEQVEIPYKVSLKFRPLSYLLYPLSVGEVRCFNGEIEVLLNRGIALALGINYFGFGTAPQNGLDSADYFTQTSFRFDPKIYISSLVNTEKYGSGFFMGPYFKYRYQSGGVFSGFVSPNTNRWILLSGLQMGAQFREKRLLISPSCGFGVAMNALSISDQIIPDFRLGLSIGIALF